MQNLSLMDIAVSILTIFSCCTVFIIVEHVTEIQMQVNQGGEMITKTVYF